MFLNKDFREEKKKLQAVLTEKIKEQTIGQIKTRRNKKQIQVAVSEEPSFAEGQSYKPKTKKVNLAKIFEF